MSNETKRDVLKKALDFFVMTGLVRGINYDFDRFHYLSEYDAALPDDLPVIPEAVSEYIKVCKKHDWNLTDSLMNMSLQVIYDTELIGDDTFALAWLLGVWRVEETGEIVKLEA